MAPAAKEQRIYLTQRSSVRTHGERDRLYFVF